MPNSVAAGSKRYHVRFFSKKGNKNSNLMPNSAAASSKRYYIYSLAS